MGLSKTVYVHLGVLLSILASCFYGSVQLIKYITFFVKSQGYTYLVLSPYESFIIITKLCLILTTIVILPYSVLLIYRNIFDALFDKEKKFINSLFWFVPLAVAGLVTSCYTTLMYIMPFLSNYNSMLDIGSTIQLTLFFNLMISNAILFILLFQVPMILFNLIKYRIVPKNKIVENKKFFILGLLVLCALLTPEDPISMLFSFCPIWVLSEGSIFFADDYDPEEDQEQEQPEERVRVKTNWRRYYLEE